MPRAAVRSVRSPLQRVRHDRLNDRAGASAQCGRTKKAGEDQAIGRSKGGLSTKIHALVDALGNPLDFILTPGQAHDLQGADALLPDMAAEVLLADKAFDADRAVAGTGKVVRDPAQE